MVNDSLPQAALPSAVRGCLAIYPVFSATYDEHENAHACEGPSEFKGETATGDALRRVERSGFVENRCDSRTSQIRWDDSGPRPRPHCLHRLREAKHARFRT